MLPKIDHSIIPDGFQRIDSGNTERWRKMETGKREREKDMETKCVKEKEWKDMKELSPFHVRSIRYENLV